jgi:branched-chain amino acid transport system substrate-binding protein
MTRGLAVLGGAAVLACGLSACERADKLSADTNSTTLTVYASLPLQGPAGPESLGVANGERLALREAGGRVGGLTVKLVVQDDSTPAAQRWDGRQTADNARNAISDKTAIAYLGDSDAGATAISLPLLNAGGILQVSPLSTYSGLTRAEQADKGEPEKYYPAGTRTFARTAPSDRFQSAALVDLVKRGSCRAVAVLDDRDVAGRGLATAVQLDLQQAGVDVVNRDSVRSDTDVAGEAAAIVDDKADCVVYGGAAAPWVPRFFDALHRAKGDIQLFGGSELAVDAFAAALAPATRAVTSFTTLGVERGGPGTRAARFAADYRAAFGSAPPAGAAYGYEAMRLVLASIAKAGPRGANRTAVARAVFTLGDRNGPLGSYRIDAHGDTSLTRYGQADAADGRITVRRTIVVPPS